MKIKATVIICVLLLISCLTSCGNKTGDSAGSDRTVLNNDNSSTKEAPESEAVKIKGTTGSWGIYSKILVPDGMSLTTGTKTNARDKNAVWVKKTDNGANFFYFILSTKARSQKDIASTIEINANHNPKEATLKTGTYEWTGVSYKYQGSEVAQMYAVIDDKVINVRMAGFAYDSDVATSILGSIKLR